MKKSIKRLIAVLTTICIILSLSCSAFAISKEDDSTREYVITVGDQTVTLQEGEKASFPLELTPEGQELFGVSTRGSWVGDIGTLTAWGSGDYYYWSITLAVPATSFNGTIHCTDLTHGRFIGEYTVHGFSGNYKVRTSAVKVGVMLDGVAWNGLTAVAKTMTNYTIWG